MKQLSLALCMGVLVALAAFVVLRKTQRSSVAAGGPSWGEQSAGGVAVVDAPPSETGSGAAPVAVAPIPVEPLAFGAASVAVQDATDQAGTALAGWGPPPAPGLDPRRFSEAHWQGLELVPKTPALSKALSLPQTLQGVIVDDVTLPADLQGFVAGDVVMAVDRVPTPNLTSFIAATDSVRDRRTATLSVYRKGDIRELVLAALFERLGTANGETPGMIPASARSPHPYQGPCTSCHKVGTNGALAVDQGDTFVTTAPPIRAATPSPHRDRGTCSACHQILP